MNLQATCALTLGGLHLNVDVVAPGGEVTVVVGPNGAGKTTLLRAMAGTVAVEAGVIALGGRILDEPPGTFVPPERRRMGVVHQDHLLFAHLSAVDNVAFGPRCRGVDVRAARRTAHLWLDRLGVGAQATARPAALSGGQAQRVALARALASEPDALLLDEPLAALDATTRSAVRRDLRDHLAGFAGPVVLVTHDPLDALTLADRLVVLEHGAVTQSGTRNDVTSRPRSHYLADLLGVNLVEGTAEGVTLTTAGGVVLRLARPCAGAVHVAIAPSAVEVVQVVPVAGGGFTEGAAPRQPRASGWVATVEGLEVVGDRVRVRLGGPLALVAEVTPAAVADRGIGEGASVWVSVDPEQLSAYER